MKYDLEKYVEESFCHISLKGVDVTNQEEVDNFMLQLDGTPNKGKELCHVSGQLN